jgi:hypothetical protein
MGGHALSQPASPEVTVVAPTTVLATAPAVVGPVHAMALLIRATCGPASGRRKKRSGGKTFSTCLKAHSVRDRQGRAPPRWVFREFAGSPALPPARSLVRLWSVCSFQLGYETCLAAHSAPRRVLCLFVIFSDESHAARTLAAAVNRLVAGSNPARGVEKSGSWPGC